MSKRVLSSFTSAVLFLAVVIMSLQGLSGQYSITISADAVNSSAQAIGYLIFTEYLLAFEVLSLLLLAAMIGAIFMANKEVME